MVENVEYIKIKTLYDYKVENLLYYSTKNEYIYQVNSTDEVEKGFNCKDRQSPCNNMIPASNVYYR